MRVRTLFLALVCTLLTSVATAQAASVTLGTDTALSVDGTSYTLVSTAPDYSGLMWEEKTPGSGDYKICLCSMFAYRTIEGLSQYLGLSELETAAIWVVTGWSTDGPEHIFSTLGWDVGTNFLFSDPITEPALLSIDDAWVSFTLGSTSYTLSSLAENYAFTDDTTHAGYQEGWDFFAYRTYFKTADGFDATKAYFQDVVRGQIVNNLTNRATFEINVLPEPSTGLILGFGFTLFAAVQRTRR
nr:hypothetical protein [uncultured Desulfobulbus sp.]